VLVKHRLTRSPPCCQLVAHRVGETDEVVSPSHQFPLFYATRDRGSGLLLLYVLLRLELQAMPRHCQYARMSK
jgi:hypothetical protein